MRKVVITGAGGFLGSYLMEEFSKSDDVHGITREQCELTNREDVANLLSGLTPDLIIHAAAMTDVEECQKNPAQAMLNNQRATKNIAKSMPSGCRIIYISTDSVYSGIGPHGIATKNENPLNTYAVTKYMGEWEVRKYNHLILRTGFYGASKNPDKIRTSLCDNLIRAFKSGEPVQLYTDSFFSPLHVKTLCKIINQISQTSICGIYNIGSQYGMSKLQFGLALARILGIEPKQIVPAYTTDVPRVRRPLDTRLDISKFESAFPNIVLPLMIEDMDNLASDVWLS